MGASLSNSSETDGPGLGDIPESCVAGVFLYLTPPEICNLARLNRAFRGAASSDTVWESKLPPNYQDLLSFMHPDRDQNLSKKAMFALLSRPFPLDDGNKKVWLDKSTGRVCMAISAKAMVITGIEDRRYWNWVPTEESSPKWFRCCYMIWVCLILNAAKCQEMMPSWGQQWFHLLAYLQQVWWFEVDGVVKFPFPADIYTLSFRIHLGRFSKWLGRRICHFERTHGWDIKPVQFELSTSDGQHAASECCLDETEQDEVMGNHKRGCWIEYKVGEFIVNESDPTTEVRFSMKQIDCTHSKGGLCVDSVSIIPSDLKKQTRKRIPK